MPTYRFVIRPAPASPYGPPGGWEVHVEPEPFSFPTTVLWQSSRELAQAEADRLNEGRSEPAPALEPGVPLAPTVLTGD